MICPLCEHEQPAGDRCDVCGKLLAATDVAASAVAPLEGLEPTSLDAAPTAAPVATAGPASACRYCGQVPGPDDVLCARCGMKLALYRPARGRAGAAVRCGQCGSGIHEVACPACGARHSLDEA